jgi:superfamily I DNA/RNA helicase
VVVATFTVKAAREMKERIAKLVGNGTEAKLVLGTFHSIARRYLMRYGHLLDLKAGWGIADSGDSLGIVKVRLGRFAEERERAANVARGSSNVESLRSMRTRSGAGYRTSKHGIAPQLQMPFLRLPQTQRSLRRQESRISPLRTL